MRQREIFSRWEGDGYFGRNAVTPDRLEQAAERDPVLQILADGGVEARRVLEVGASNGWRLACLSQRRPETVCVGVEPSLAAVTEGARHFPDVSLVRGTAERLPFESGRFDLVILGFFLYLCDRDDLFRVAAETDRVLARNGFVVVFDFCPSRPHRNSYRHRPDVYSYKMDYAQMFLWNPVFRQVQEKRMPHPGADPDDLDNRIAVSLLRRDPQNAYPTRTDQSLSPC